MIRHRVLLHDSGGPQGHKSLKPIWHHVLICHRVVLQGSGGSQGGSIDGENPARDEPDMWRESRQAVYEEERGRLGGADSPDARDFQDSMSSAQQAMRERSMQSHDMRTLASDA